MWWTIALLVLLLAFLASQWFAEDRAEIEFTFFHQPASGSEHQVAGGSRAASATASSSIRRWRPCSRRRNSRGTDQATERRRRLATPAAAPAQEIRRHTCSARKVDAELRQELIDAGVELIGPAADAITARCCCSSGWDCWSFLIFGGWSMARRARDQMLGGGMLPGVLRSPARRYAADGQRVTFNDVAGLGNVKKDLQEIVDFLRDPAKFQQLGARVPKGVLLMGPPGTGKTLLAKAVAGEAGVPFFSINGSEFIQLFVGVGAGRVRDLFQTAQANAPAILFIDEIDAVGRQRGAGLGGGHDEREQTLNQILSEMDGFSPTSTVIVLAATNRPDVLDPALLRPGRFDRHITVDRPTLAGRRELFEVHSRDVPLADDVDFERLARATVGMTGADIRNLVNEAALWATRQRSERRPHERLRVRPRQGAHGCRPARTCSPTRRSKSRRTTKPGHALLAWLTPGCDRVHKVTILPRGPGARASRSSCPRKSATTSRSRTCSRGWRCCSAAGRPRKSSSTSISAGAENDLQEATRLARRMVTHWGMSERLGPVAYHMSEDHPFLGREIAQHERQFSEHTAQVIDEEVAKILHAAEDRAKNTLQEHADKLTALAEALLEREELNESELRELIGASACDSTDRARPARAVQVAASRE